MSKVSDSITLGTKASASAIPGGRTIAARHCPPEIWAPPYVAALSVQIRDLCWIWRPALSPLAVCVHCTTTLCTTSQECVCFLLNKIRTGLFWGVFTMEYWQCMILNDAITSKLHRSSSNLTLEEWKWFDAGYADKRMIWKLWLDNRLVRSRTLLRRGPFVFTHCWKPIKASSFPPYSIFLSRIPSPCQHPGPGPITSMLIITAVPHFHPKTKLTIIVDQMSFQLATFFYLWHF